MLMIFAPGFVVGCDLHAEAVEAGQLVREAPEVLRFEAQNHVGIGDVGDGVARMAV